MTYEELWHLRPGDIVQPHDSTQTFVITVNFGQHCLAVLAREVTHAEDWTLVRKACPHEGPA
jgi:hypothetical protein